MALSAAAAGTIGLGDGLQVRRLGYGAMRITGPGIWGPPEDPDAARSVLRRAVELGVDFVDTADAYGPAVSEDLIRQALWTGTGDMGYGDVTIATKAGLTRQGPDEWRPVGRPEYLRQCLEMSLRRLGVDTIDLWQLHRIDPAVPAAEQFGVLAEAVEEGKVRRVGLSQVTADEVVAAGKVIDVASVQNRYNLTHRDDQDVLDHCAAEGIAFIPWFPIHAAKLAQGGGVLGEVAQEVDATPAQVSLAWLLHTSEVTLPIPGTSTVAHLEENVAAAEVELSEEQVRRLDAVGA